jgi:hypothetical protein
MTTSESPSGHLNHLAEFMPCLTRYYTPNRSSFLFLWVVTP